MPKLPLPAEVLELLAAPNPAVISTVRPDGHPVSVATWYVLDDDGTLTVNMDGSRKRLEYLRRDPRVSLTVLRKGDWYTHVSIQGTVELRDDTDFRDIDRIARRYTGKPYDNRTSPRISARITPEHWHGWSGSGPWQGNG
jgi:PPOX class probable F420-dependent enzyme